MGPLGPLLLASLLALAVAAPARQAEPREGSAPVSVHFTVTDRQGAFVAGLSAADFTLKEDGRPRPIDTVAPDPDPGTFILLLDRSGSVTLDLDRITRLGRAIVTGFGPQDRMQIAELDPHSPARPAMLSSDRAALLDAVQPSSSPTNATMLWERLASAIETLAAQPGYRAVIVVSDGQDSMSRINRSDVTARAQRARVVVHAIEVPVTIRPLVLNGRPMALQVRNELRHVVTDSGGTRQVLPQVRDDVAVATVLDAVRHRYVVRFTPRVQDGKAHALELRTVNKDLSVQAARRY